MSYVDKNKYNITSFVLAFKMDNTKVSACKFWVKVTRNFSN